MDCLDEEGWGVLVVNGLDEEGWGFFGVDTSGIGKFSILPFGRLSKLYVSTVVHLCHRRPRARLDLKVLGLHLFSLQVNFSF